MLRQQQRPPRPDPFRAYSAVAAQGYEAWYQTPAGGANAAEEERALGAMLATLPQAETVLEVGCGTGHFTRWLADTAHYSRVLGVDPSPGMLAVARAAGGSSQYLRAAAEALPFAAASVDVVVFITTLEFLPDPERALQEAARVARQGLVLGVLNRASPLGLRRTVAAWFRPSVYRAAEMSTVGSLGRLLQRALPGQVQVVHWTTALWPRGTPRPLRRLPCGGFIALAAALQRPRQGAT